MNNELGRIYLFTYLIRDLQRYPEYFNDTVGQHDHARKTYRG